ncbi:phage minor capsid protein [Paramicrobacterium agarici]|uniref:phage minor capsid protein n=1 Tax=Paramicrobacterium agarici TaxID=630514 RepID=UPI0011668131|nr:phage minor capsid protein [Microbacterium agarici]TQO23792.1 minor capsid protein 2 [Microbacterium agarici]
MAVYVPDAENPVPAADLIEDLGAYLAGVYTTAETRMLEAAAKRAYKILALEQDLGNLSEIEHQRAMQRLEVERAQALRELRDTAERVVTEIRDQDLAEWLVDVASQEGEAAAGATLSGTRYETINGQVPTSAAHAVGATGISLQSRLETLNQRIIRYPQDVYQQTIADTAPFRMLGVETSTINQRRAVQKFLEQGITGFIDRADRRWTIGAYSEMAGRTATSRAWQDAGIHRMQQSGLNLVSIQGSFDACKLCAPWIGKVLSTNGVVGPVIMPHATQPGAVTVHVEGTLQDARDAGWNHPNCRDRVTAVLPGLSVPQQDFQYNPEAEKERAKQRELEREIRAAKRKQAVASDDIQRRKAGREVKDAQADLREFTKKTGRQRRSYREQLHFADGR